MRYSDVASGIVVHAGETVSVLAVLVDTVLVWPAPAPAAILTGRPAHWSTVHVLVMSCSVVAVCVMTYSDVPSGIGSQAGETVSVSVVLDTTVRVWPAPVPALITTGRPAHWFAVHALVLSASAVLDAVMMYLDVPSGVVIHAGDTVSVFVVLEDTVRVWPAPVPAVILTTSPAHWLAVHALGPVLVVSWSVVLVCPMTYWDVPSGVVVHAGEAVGVVLRVVEGRVGDWRRPRPSAYDKKQ